MPSILIRIDAVLPAFPVGITHVSTDWEIATDEAFTNIITSSLNDTGNLHTFHAILSNRPPLYGRSRINTSSGSTEWSTPTVCLSNINTPSITVEGDPSSTPHNPILVCSPFSSAYSLLTHASTDWIISDSSGTLIWSEINNTTNTEIIAVPFGLLNVGETYTLNVRHVSTSGEFSGYGVKDFTVDTLTNVIDIADGATISFTGPVINKPLLTITGEPNHIGVTPTLTTNGFSLLSGSDIHVSTDWLISDTNTNNTIFSSLNNTVNLTNLVVSNNLLTHGASYAVRVRHNGESGVSSPYQLRVIYILGATGGIVTSTNDVVIATPTLTVEGEPSNMPLSPTLTTSAFNVLLNTDTHTSTDWVMDDGNGNTVWVSLGDSTNLLTITVPPGILNTSTTYIVKARHNGAISSSNYSVKTVSSIGVVNAWHSTTPHFAPIANHSQSTLDNGRILVVGSAEVQDPNGPPGTLIYTNTSELYNPIDSSWTSVALRDAVNIYYNQSQSTLIDGKVLVVGGTVRYGTDITVSVRSYNPTNNTWSTRANYPIPIHDHTQTTLDDGRVLVVGGIELHDPINTCNIYNPALNTWSAAANYPTLIRAHSASLLTDGRVLVVGGNNSHTHSPVTACNIYNPNTNAWTSIPPISIACSEHSQSTLLDGRVVVKVGIASHVYDPTSNVWLPLITIPFHPTATSNTSQSTLLDGKIMTVGGTIVFTAVNDSTIYTP